jgi:hypothetical protein
MLLFLDTEFTDFVNCDLISLGMVSEDGQHEFYAEIVDHETEWQSQFVKDVVVPLLYNEQYGITRAQAAADLRSFVEQLNVKELVFVVDYPTDWLLIRELLTDDMPTCDTVISSAMINPLFWHTAQGRGINSQSAMQEAARKFILGIEDYYLIDNRRHHALVDAKANRHGWTKGLE